MENKKLYFEELNKELNKENLELILICAGGFTLEINGIRGTVDVDAFFDSKQKIEEIIYKVGEKYNLNMEGELWLNNSIANLNKWPPKEVIEGVYEFSNLVVDSVELEYLLGMKHESMRERDLLDIVEIIKKLNVEDPIPLYKYLKKHNFSIEKDDLVSYFAIAKGEEWYREYRDKSRYHKPKYNVLNNIKETEKPQQPKNINKNIKRY